MVGLIELVFTVVKSFPVVLKGAKACVKAAKKRIQEFMKDVSIDVPSLRWWNGPEHGPAYRQQVANNLN